MSLFIRNLLEIQASFSPSSNEFRKKKPNRIFNLNLQAPFPICQGESATKDILEMNYHFQLANGCQKQTQLCCSGGPETERRVSEMLLSCSCSLLVIFVLTYLAKSVREVLLISC